MGLEKVIELAKTTTTGIAQSAADSAEALRDAVPTTADLSAVGVERLRSLIGALDQALPFVNEAGYTLDNMFVELGLPPRLVVRARRTRAVTEAEQADLRERAKEHSVASVVLQAFLLAASLQDTLSVGSLRVAEVEIEATTVPRVRLYFTHQATAIVN
jgi:hypothetical protein